MSNSVILRGLVAIAGIVSASVVPDTYAQTVADIAAIEAENIPSERLGDWLSQQHHARLSALMEKEGYGKGYKYAHDYANHYIKQQYMPDQLQDTVFWHPQGSPQEQKMAEWMKHIRQTE